MTVETYGDIIITVWFEDGNVFFELRKPYGLDDQKVREVLALALETMGESDGL